MRWKVLNGSPDPNAVAHLLMPAFWSVCAYAVLYRRFRQYRIPGGACTHSREIPECLSDVLRVMASSKSPPPHSGWRSTCALPVVD